MTRVFLDTNILLDVALHREHFEEGFTILQLAEEGLIEVFASTLTYANIAYILRKHPKDEIYEYLRVLREGVVVLPMDAAGLDAAIKLKADDFFNKESGDC